MKLPVLKVSTKSDGWRQRKQKRIRRKVKEKKEHDGNIKVVK